MDTNRLLQIIDKYKESDHWDWDLDIEVRVKLNQAEMLLRLFEKNRKFGQLTRYDKDMLELDYKHYNRRLLERKAERKKQFETKATYETMFYSTSLNADYGQFVCSKCGRTFYHSPSKIYRGKNLIISHICGYCTNQYFDKAIFE